MDMDQSLRDALNQLIALQTQQLGAITALASSGRAAPQFNNSYMNYAPDYMPPMMPFSQSTEQAQNKFNNYAGHAEGTKTWSDRFFEDKSRISYEQSSIQAADRGTKYGNAILAGGGLAASAIGDIGGMMLAPGLVGSLAAGAVGGAAAGALFDIGLKQNEQHMAYNKYLQRESYRFINPTNSTNERDIAGFGQNDRFEAAKYLRHFGTENRVSDQETSMLMEKFTEGNLLKGTKDLQGFKDKMKGLTKYVKESALLLNETFDNIANLMSEMKKAGIDVTNVDYFASKSKVVGAFTGMSAGEAGNFAFGSAVGAVRGTMFGAENEQYKRFDNLLIMGGLYDKATDMKDKDPRMREIHTQISNLGGVKEATALISDYQNRSLTDKITQHSAANFYDYDKRSGRWTFNKESFDEFIKSGKSIKDVSLDASRKLDAAGAIASNSWLKNAETNLRNSLGMEQINDLKVRVTEAKTANTIFAGQNLSLEEQLRILGENSAEDKLWAAQEDYRRGDGKDLKRKAQAYGYQQNLQASINASRRGFGYEVANQWEGIKDYVGDISTKYVGEPIVRASTAVNDWWYGKEYKLDRKAIEKGMTAEEIESAGKDVAKSLINGVEKELRDAKNRGYNVSKDTLDKIVGSKDNLTTDTTVSVGPGGKIVNNKSFTQSGMKDLYESTTDLRTSVFLTDNQEDTARKKVYSALGKSWGIEFDGSAKSLEGISGKMNKESSRIDTMIKGYNDAKTPLEKSATEWGKLSTNERMGLLQVRESTGYLRREEKPLSVWDNMTDSDREEVRKIHGSSDNLTYDPTYKGNADPGKYMRWSSQGGKLLYDSSGKSRNLKGGTYKEITAEIEANLKAIEKDSVKVIEDTNEMMTAKELDFSNSADSRYQSIIQKALAGDKEAIKKLNEYHKIEGGSDKNSTTFKTLNKALLLVNQKKAPGVELTKKSLQDMESSRKQMAAFGQVGGTIISAITGNTDDAAKFIKKYNAGSLDNVGIGGEEGLANTGTQEITNYLSSLKGNQKGIDSFISGLPVEAGTGDIIRSKLTDAFSGKVDEQEALKGVIDEIMKSTGQTSKDAGDLGKNAKDAADGKLDGDKSMEELKGESTKLIKNINDLAELFKENNMKTPQKEEDNFYRKYIKGNIPYIKDL